MRKANFGTGSHLLDDYENYDLFPYNDKVKKFNNDILPYRFSDDSFGVIECKHLLEHLNSNALDVMKEFHRISKPDGRVVIELPIFGNLVSHNRFYHSRNYFNPIMVRKLNNTYIENLFYLNSFSKKQRCSFKKILWKMKTRFFTWIDSFFYDSYEWDLTVKK